MASEIDLKVSADIGDLRRQLESIPGITAEQAKLMVAELDRGYKKAEKAAAAAAKATKASMKQTEEATRKAADASKELGDRFGDVGSSAGRMAGALDMIAPGLGGLGQSIADLADVGEVAAGSLGSFAAPAIGVLAAAAVVAVPVFMHLNAAMAAEAEAARVMGQYNAFATNEMELQRTAVLDLAVATGNMTQEERLAADARHTSSERLGDFLTTLSATVAETRKAEIRNTAIAETIGTVIDKLNKLNPILFLASKLFGKAGPSVTDLSLAFAQFIGVTGNLAAAEDTAAQAAAGAIARVKETNTRQEEAARAKTKHAAASKVLTTALKVETVQMDALVAAQGAISQATAKEMTDSQKLAKTLADLQTERIELSEAGKLTPADIGKYATAEEALAQQVTDARIDEELRAVTAIQAYEDGLAASRNAAAEEEKAQAKAATQARINAIAQVADVIAQYTQYSLDQDVAAYEQAQEDRNALGKNATKAEKDLADERLEITRNAARKAFLIDKLAKMASAAAATALAVVQALSSGPPPFNFIAAGAVGAAGLIQQGVIMSQQPTFHAGGFVGGGMAPDEQQATVRRGEAVLNPAGRRAMGDDAIRAANGGMGGGQTIVVQQVYRHRVFDSFVRDNLRTRGPLSQALGSGSRAGQRRS
jgi:hypothetical protein